MSDDVKVVENDVQKFRRQKLKATFTIDRTGNGLVKLKGTMSERGAFEVARAILMQIKDSENVKMSARMKIRKIIQDMETIDDERQAEAPKKKKPW